jgi:rubrerythrin
MPTIKGTETEKNLLKSFAGESQARNRYTYFSSIARKEGYVQISAFFETTANQEKEHAKRFFKFLEGGDLEITASYPAGNLGTTVENLKAAAMGENEEWTELYPHFADVAAKEGFPEVAAAYRSISVAEKHHEARYLNLLSKLENNTMFESDQESSWVCRNCGYVHTGDKAPKKCVACLHPQSHFELMNDVLQ